MFSVSFQDNGGAPVSNYIVEKMDPRVGKWEKCTKFARQPEYEVLDLEEGHEYKFRVMAENQYGVSEPLEIAKPVVAKHPFTEPGSPGTPEVIDVDEDAITIAWDPPKDDGGNKVQGYVVEMKEPDGRWKQVSPGLIRDNQFTGQSHVQLFFNYFF